MNDDYYLGRSCPTEAQIDLVTGAKLCELPNTAQTSEKPLETPSTQAIPRVGVGIDIILPIIGAILMLAVMYWRDKNY
jgi:hypothetical protein